RAGLRAECRDRRHRLRPARTCVRARVAEQRPCRSRRGVPTRASGRLGARLAGRADRGRSTEQRVRGDARRQQWRRGRRGTRLRSADCGRTARVDPGRPRRRTRSDAPSSRTRRSADRPRGTRFGSRLRLVAVAIPRARTVSARTFLRIATASSVALFLVITSGAFVRLTGSGLGCENWPSCGDRPYPEQGFHAFVEFGNRMVALAGIVLTLVTFLASRRTEGLSGWGRWAALGAWSLRTGRAPAAGPRWLRLFVTCAGLPACVALVVTGAVATASGPHPGS